MIKGKLIGRGTPKEYIEWILYFAEAYGTASFSITENSKPFDTSTDYFFTQITRHTIKVFKINNSRGDKEYQVFHYLHSTGPDRDLDIRDEKCDFLSRAQVSLESSCPYEFTPSISLRQPYADKHEEAIVLFNSTTKAYRKVKEELYRPCLDYVNQPLYIHILVKRWDDEEHGYKDLGTQILASTKPFWLFRKKDSNNNPLALNKANEPPPAECDVWTATGIPRPSQTPELNSSIDSKREHAEGSKSTNSTAIIVGVVLVSILFVLIGLLLYFLCREGKPTTAKKSSDNFPSSSPSRN